MLAQLPQAAHVSLHCRGHQHFPWHPPPEQENPKRELRIAWTALSSRPGSFCLAAPQQWSRMVIGNVGSQPDFQEPWAIWVRHWCSVQGLPWHRFQQLPSGWWVWRNAAAAHLGQQEPEHGGDWAQRR